MKKILLSTFILSSFNVLALEEKSNCTVSELNKDKSHFCLIKNEDYYIKEVLNDIKENQEIDLFSNSYNKRYNQIKKVKKIKNISKELFEKNINFENQRGLAIITTDEGDLYTTRVGYIQKNGHYLEIENNEIEEFQLEEIKNPKKIISRYNLYVLDKDNTLWKKSNNEWSKVDIKNVYDFEYTENGLVYVVSKSGIYFGEDKKELSDLELELMNINIEESLYKDKIKKEDYEEYVIKSIINEKLNFEILNIDLFPDDKLIEVKIKLKDKDFEVYMWGGELRVIKKDENKKKYNGYYDLDSCVKSANKLNLYDINYREDKSKNLPEKYSLKYNKYFIADYKNIIETKYNGNILFVNQEKEIQYNAKYLENKTSFYKTKSSSIIKSLENETHYFVLRNTGKLTVIDKETNNLKEILNVNRIEKEKNDVKILIDPQFNNQLKENINKYKIIDGDDLQAIMKLVKEEKVFVVKFKDIDTLNNINLEVYSNPICLY